MINLHRLLLYPLLAGLVMLVSPSAHAERDGPRVASVDWTLAETLIALDAAPVGVAQTAAYQAWVRQPQLPKAVVDIGLRAQPNRELLAQLEPDLILISPMFSAMAASLERIAPVESVALYEPGGDLWTRLQQATRRVAGLVEREAEAERLLTNLDQRLALLEKTLDDDLPAMLVVQFIDDRHLRVFGEHSLFHAVIERLGLDNAWQGTTNYWGFSTVAIERLAEIDSAQLIIIDPVPLGVESSLAESVLWQQLPAVSQRPPLTLPPVWSFGGAPSALRFAELLAERLTTTPHIEQERTDG